MVKPIARASKIPGSNFTMVNRTRGSDEPLPPIEGLDTIRLPSGAMKYNGPLLLPHLGHRPPSCEIRVGVPPENGRTYTSTRREFWMQYFNRDLARMAYIPREIVGRHPATAELAFERVAVGESGSEPFSDYSHEA